MEQSYIKPLLEVYDLKTYFPLIKGIFAKTVGYVKAVEKVSFSIPRGKTLGLVGESGCGKTTLGRTIIGLEKAFEGEIFFLAANILSLSKKELKKLRRRMQIIFQDPLSSLNPRMNILDIITEGLFEFNMIEGTKENHAKKLLHDVGLNESALYRYPHEFSGGQRQRINIARAISLKPDLIVCDEPVSALDVSVQAQIINLLKDLRDKYHLSYLFISHDLSVVSNIANRVAVMYLGKIVEEASVEEIINSPMHPYTKALIEAIPRHDMPRRKKNINNGQIPSLSSNFTGCAFHPRCIEKMAICGEKEPIDVILNSRWVKCHLYSKLAGIYENI